VEIEAMGARHASVILKGGNNLEASRLEPEQKAPVAGKKIQHTGRPLVANSAILFLIDRAT
jgi:hypothetical protein